MIRTVPLALLAFWTTGCGVTRETTPSATDSYPRAASRWSSPTIPVCWESSAAGFTTEKAWVRQKVEAQYETKTVVRFGGWGNCATGASGIRIAVSDAVGANPHTKGLGRALNGKMNGMQLNFTFKNWSSSCKSHRRRCIESIGVHEFGHAVGLAHEHNRPDTPDTCTKSRQGSSGDRTIGDWDVNSAMNYCNPVYNNGGNLSAGDVAGIEFLYGDVE